MKRRKSIETLLAGTVLLVTIMCAAGAFAAEGRTETYVSLLVQPEWVKANLDKVVLIDARARSLYEGQHGHLPGAVNAEWVYFANMNGKAGDPTYGALLDAAATAKKIGALGIDGKKDIVVYGDGGDWGNADKTATNKAAAFAGTKRDDSYIVGTDWMKENYNNPEIKVVDVRGADEYTGKIRPFGERRHGHIPGAVNLSWDSVYTKDFTVLPEAELAAVFENAGFADKDQTIVCYDTSGVRGAFMTMMFRLAGYANARCYNPSYQAWCADPDTEIIQGPNP